MRQLCYTFWKAKLKCGHGERGSMPASQNVCNITLSISSPLPRRLHLLKCQHTKCKINVKVSIYQLSKYLQTLILDRARGWELTKFVNDDSKTFPPRAQDQSCCGETRCCIELETQINNPCSDPINHSNRCRSGGGKMTLDLHTHKLLSTMFFVCANHTLISKWV